MNLLFKTVYAASTNAESAVNSIVAKIVGNIVAPIVEFVFVLAILIFIWGILGFFKGAEDASARETGKQHILWGVIGIGIMISVYGIIRLVYDTIGISSPF